MEMMALLYSRFMFLFVLIIFMWGQMDSAEGGFGRDFNYITWDDFRVDELSLVFNLGQLIVVDQNGAGHSRTVQGAVDMVPHHNTRRVKIFILPGTYRERVNVPISKPYVSFIGTKGQTVITWNSKSSDKGPDGKEVGTYNSATVGVDADYFCATGITFENSVVSSAGESGKQAVALRVSSPRAMFYDVIFNGTQDTLLDNEGHHYFYKCHIIGKVDFICGNAKSLYEECILESISENSGAIAAHHRNSSTEDTGFSFVRCNIRGTGKVFLGRPWGDYARTIYSHCNMDGSIDPVGWSDWEHESRRNTSVFAEYQCKGVGANRRHRVPWSKSFNSLEARPFLYKSFINGHHWLKVAPII